MPLNPEDRTRLLAGVYRNPHALLGPHPEPGGGVRVRALRPGAQRVTLHAAGLRVPLRPEGDGLFSTVLPLPQAPAYQLVTRWPDGSRQETADPYRFLPSLGPAELELIRQGRHERLWQALGAHVRCHQGERGTRFTVWAPAARGVRLQRVGTFRDPVYVTAPPGDRRRVFVVEQSGRIMLLLGGKRVRRPFLNLSAEVTAGGEQGLLSMAFAPDYAASGRFYVYFTDRGGDQRVQEFRRSSGSPAATARKPRSRRNVRIPENET